jgi:GTP-binding protein
VTRSSSARTGASPKQLFAGPVEFVAGAATEEALPIASLPEVAFAGRSNVGKSSLVNALTGRNSLARTSRSPGRTQQINFFSAGGRLLLVDLPGYGFARAAKSRIASWSALIERYLRGRPTLKRVLILIDSRHGLKDSDRELFRFLDSVAVSYQVVLTKIDTADKGEAEARQRDIGAELALHGAAHPEVLATSARKGTGIPTLREAVAALANA